MPRIFITSGTSYTLPADFSGNNTIECYGGGASASSGAGGGGGAYAKSSNVNIAAGTLVNIQVGSSGQTDTWFNATSLANAVANGVSISCGAQGAVGATGGSASSSCGSVKYNGGTGGYQGTGGTGGGGGGGCAGPSGAGGNGGNPGAPGNPSGGGGGGANSGQNGPSAYPSNNPGAGGYGRLGSGGGAAGTTTNVAAGNGATNSGGGGGGGYVNFSSGGYGAIDDVYGGGVYGPGGGGGGGSNNANGGGSYGYGAGAGGAGLSASAGTPTSGFIVVTYVSAPVGGPSGGGLTAAPILSLRTPYFIANPRSLRSPDPPLIKMDWLKQSADLLQPPPRKILFRPIKPTPIPAPNLTPLYKPPWLQWPELLRHPVAGLDYRQQFPGKKPLDFFANLIEGADTVSTGATPVYVNSPITADLYDYDQVYGVVNPAPALGGPDDIIRRVKLLLPKGWWNYHAPIRDAIIGGLSDVSAWCYGLYVYAKKQTRVAWATDIWLDIISHDYFRFTFLRRVNEGDDSFRVRIQKELIRERVTRKGMMDALTDLTGQPPVIFEPWNTGDTGAWDEGHFAWDIGGGWGDTILPAQSFVNVIPPGAGIAGAPGWDCAAMGWDVGGMWGDMSLIVGTVTDQDIYDTINKTRPTGAIVWTQLSAPQGPLPIPVAPGLTPTFAPPGMNQAVVLPGAQRYSVSTSMTVGLL